MATWERVVEDKTARVVVVSGTHGVGKTWLVEQFLDAIRDGAPDDQPPAIG